MVLLAAAGALILLVTANSAHLVDETRQRDLVRREASARLSHALATPCLVTGATFSEPAGPRTRLDVVSSTRRAVHTVSVDAWWQASGFAGHRWHRQASTVSGWCE